MSKDQIVMQAETFAGLSAGKTLDTFCAKVFRYDTKADAESMAKGQSCCGTTCEAILRDAGVDGTIGWAGVTRDWLRYPYAKRMGSTVAFQRALFQKHGLWIDASHWKPGDPLPDDADMIEVSGPDHVLTVARMMQGRNPPLEVTFATIEGGQPDSVTGHDSAILAKQRTLTIVNGRLTLDGHRPIVGWGKAGEMPCVF